MTNMKEKATPAALLSDQAQDIPIFLRKTYHMVDTCDPSIACWSEDGETFVVKDPVKFEQQIIPQFFKHSKFSSFVRQLNFYAFRKIKYADTIRIDPKLEAETANYWRFRHEKFQRGKPELLQEIKRMNGQKGTSTTKKPTPVTPTTVSSSAASTAAAVVPAVSPAAVVVQENTALKTEVNQLKSKLEQMTKNIDELTMMVQKVSLQQQTAPKPPAPVHSVNANNKRTKVDDVTMPPLPDINHSMDVDMLPPSIPSPMHPTLSTSETPTDLSDDSFVDQLFTAFKTENFDFIEEPTPLVAPSPTASSSSNNNHNNKKNTNKPRPELMQRLSEALEVLPTSIQELIVNRLIQAITAPQEIQKAISGEDEGGDEENINTTNATKSALVEDVPLVKQPDFPMAALLALISQYEKDAKAAANKGTANNNSNNNSNNHKALLIPVHA